MKTVPTFSRMMLAFMLGILMFTSCKKDNDTTPSPMADLATRIAGQYTYSELSYGGKTRPADQTDMKGSIVVTRKTATTVNMVLDFRIKSSGEEFLVLSADDVQVTETGGEVSFMYQGSKVGILKANKLTINGEDDANVPFGISATK
ncbi:hypothetical protein [Fibrella forsythiae]|uniref:Lipocalin-like domain-containing protein n=1 Tax=Fibrella forsythiae TaxID=2817061 RepID=A0ABS3JRF6_9BACT|nr:hypothetical protein [Fibrella forsythiae]MBO0952596.1 hypothetical protein [Fibrella forsythiae]